MKNLDIKNEVGSTLFIIKKNYRGIFINLIGLFSFSLSSISSFVLICVNNFEWDTFGYFIISFVLAAYFIDLYERGKEQCLIITKDSFIIKYSNNKKVQEFDFWGYDLHSVSIKSNGEVILLSESEFPWGNRKVFLSDDYLDRKNEVLTLLNRYI